jgi:hypothetical protein
VNQWLANFLFLHTPRVTKPDKRPLYAYRCSEKKYAELTHIIRQEIILEIRSKPVSPQFPALFCLYAAETFCRQHNEGAWTWETIFNPLGMKTPPNQKTSDWVKQGLEWWGRPLIRRQSGDRQFLVSIACEGGLPLNLLRNETAISQFFRTVLGKYHVRQIEGESYAEQIASEQAFLLPSGLRQDVVFRLAGELIANIVKLQATVNGAANPVEALNTTHPNWRKQLPLRLEDKTAEVLLTGLMHHSSELSKDASTRICWHGSLRNTASGWQVEKTLDTPTHFSVEQIAAWAGQQQISTPRLRLVLHTHEGSDAVASLTLNQRNEGEVSYRREWLYRSGVKRSGAAVTTLHEIHTNIAETNYRIPIHNGEPWGELPWVFIGQDGATTWKWLTEGSASTRSEVALVAVKDSFTPIPSERGETQRLGVMLALGRVIYRVAGEVQFASPNGDTYRIRCRAERDSDESFDLIGNTVNEILNERPVFRGLPFIRISNASGKRHKALGKIQWRPLHSQGAWREGDAECRGRVWIRLMETDSGAERFRRQVDIVPKSFRIERSIGTNNHSGEYQLLEIGNASLASLGDQVINIQSAWNAIKVTCPVLEQIAPEPLKLLLHWSSVDELEIVLPYPQRGAVFQLVGKTLAAFSIVPLGRLGGLQLFLQDQSDSSQFTLDVQLEGSVLGFRQTLPPLKNGCLVFALEVERDRIASLLASTNKQDIAVKIKIFCGHECLSTINISRFDLTLQPDRANNRVTVVEKSVLKLGDDWATRIHVEMIPLWNPLAEPIPLLTWEDSQDTWDIPSNLDAGPWWIIGRDGGWARFRPLLWSVKRDATDMPEPTVETDLSLKTAILANESQRTYQLPALMTALGENPEHPDWPLVFDYIHLTREFPPSTLDVLKYLSSHPPALALALFKSDEETFDQVWSLSEQMPFSWSLISANIWLDAAQRYFGSLRKALASIESAEDIVWSMFKAFRERTTNHRDSWKPLCDWLQEQLFPKMPTEGGSLLKLARLADGNFLKELIPRAEQDLQSRHDANELWPQSQEVMQYCDNIQSKYHYKQYNINFRPVRCAPFVAAQLSLQGIQPSPLLIYQLRLIRAFDAKWFFEIYGIALALGLAALSQEKIK